MISLSTLGGALLGEQASRALFTGLLAASLASLAGDGANPLAAVPDPAQAPAKTEAVQAGQKLNVAFSDPTKPGLLKINLITGSIHVTGYEGKDVTIDARTEDDDEDEKASRNAPAGMRRIPNRGLGLVVEEERNEMRINSSMPQRALHLTIQVPVRTSLKLSTINDGDIIVDRVDGDLEVNNTNGPVTLNNVSGTVIAHALNGTLKATLVRASDKPMSFSSLNGDIDITLPATIKANVRLESTHGEVYTDFAVDVQPTTMTSKAEDNRGKGGKYRLEIEKAVTGKINGGGPEIRFKTFNGSIQLHKGS